MKSTRSRSRSKNNRNRNSNHGGNVVNRVFDSSGPEGKVRGTPAQVIEKYNQLARDATLSNDRVAAENFQQHAEHYLRLLSEAQKEQEQRREEQDRINRERQAERDRERAERQERESAAGGEQSHATDPAEAPQPDVVTDLKDSDQDSGLVDTPESKPKPKRQPRRKPKPKPVPAAEADAPPDSNEPGGQPEAG
ncbi:MAG: DUF4167 domain-containing protein [Pseudomonadota bacterium]